MHRFVRWGLGLLLGGVVALPAAAQRSPTRPAIALEEPRANPAYPVALVPFAVAPEICRQGHVPHVSLRVSNSLSQTVAVLRLRDRPTVVLDSIPLKCGEYVAVWDGTVSNGTRAASPGLYFFYLKVDDFGPTKKLLFTAP